MVGTLGIKYNDQITIHSCRKYPPLAIVAVAVILCLELFFLGYNYIALTSQ